MIGLLVRHVILDRHVSLVKHARHVSLVGHVRHFSLVGLLGMLVESGTIGCRVGHDRLVI